MYGCESWSIKKAELQRIDAFELWCWRRLLRVPWTARRYSQSILKDISPGCSVEGLIWSWNSNTLAIWCKELIHVKRPWCWVRLRAGGEGDDREWDGWMASHPLSSPSPAFNLSQYQGLFQWVTSSHQVAKVLELHHQYFQWIFRTDFF